MNMLIVKERMIIDRSVACDILYADSLGDAEIYADIPKEHPQWNERERKILLLRTTSTVFVRILCYSGDIRKSSLTRLYT